MTQVCAPKSLEEAQALVLRTMKQRTDRRATDADVLAAEKIRNTFIKR